MIKGIANLIREQIGEVGNLSPEIITIIDAPLIGTDHFLNKDGSLTTVLAIDGSFKIMGDDNYKEFADYLFNNLKGTLKKEGHILGVSFNKDNTLTKNKLRENLATGWRKGAYGFRVKDILMQQEDVLKNRVSYERGYLSITTTTKVLPKTVEKKAKKRARDAFNQAINKHMTEGEQASHTQLPKMFVRDILRMHEAFVSRLFTIFSKFLDISVLKHHDVIKEYRSFYYPESATTFFKAKIFNNHAEISVADNSSELSSHNKSKTIIQTEKKGNDNDVSNLMYPGLIEQIILSDPVLDDDRMKEAGVSGVVKVGKRYYAPVILSSPPERYLRFDELFKNIDFKIPFRMSMTMYTGKEKMIGKLSSIQRYATFLGITNSDNRIIKESASELINAYKIGDDLPLANHMLFVTWGNTPEIADSNRDNLISAIQSWGSADAVAEYGDPFLSTMEAIPGFTRKHTAPGFITALTEIILALPYTRPSSPWKDGTLNFYTENNKIWPYSIGSSQQQTWIELISASPGAGKSVWMAASNISLILNQPNNMLPKIGVIDVGPSGKYMCDFIQAILPEELKHEVKSYKIKMSKEFAFNPFDTLLG